MFLVGFLGWTWDSFDFFTVSMTVTEISEDFNVSVTSVTWVCQKSFRNSSDCLNRLTYQQGITITLMLRSVGALLSGFLSDRYGRKWPFIITMATFIVLELGSGFCQNLPQFLGVRALYGIAMGGKYDLGP